MTESLSVIIPAYQAEKYIAQAVASVRAQNWPGQVQILVIDDGSRDNTAAAAQALGVQVLRKTQGGAASARNEGLKLATGQLILLLDADDVLTKGALAAMAAAMAENSTDAVFAMAEDFISPELTDAEKAELKPRPTPYGGVLPGCSLIRKSVFDAIGLFEGGLAELCDVTVAVTAPEEDRIRRLMIRDSISEEYARKRISAQHSEAWFREKCDDCLANDGQMDAFATKCLAFLERLRIIEEKRKGANNYDH